VRLFLNLRRASLSHFLQPVPELGLLIAVARSTSKKQAKTWWLVWDFHILYME